MQKDEVVEFLSRIDAHITNKLQSLIAENGFKLKIIGKSALLLGGLTDSIGTVDIDSLGVDGKTASKNEQKIVESLVSEFGRSRVEVNGYYIEFVAPAIVFLPQKSKWIPLKNNFASLSVEFLEPQYVVASKLFSAFSSPPRKRDKQDIVAALDQKLVAFQDALEIADRIFDFYSMDARNDRFTDVHKYIVKELMTKYGKAHLKYVPEE